MRTGMKYWAWLAIPWMLGGASSCNSADSPNQPMPVSTPADSSEVVLSEKERLLAEYNHVLAQDPTDLGAMGNRARLYEQMGQPIAALADYDALLLSDPNNAPALERRASLLAKEGKFEAAVQDYDRLMQNPETDVALLLNGRGKAKLDGGQAKQAEADFSAALELRPNWAEAMVNRGAARYALGAHALAREDFSMAIALDPKASEAYNGLGLIAQFVDNDLAVAEVDFSQALMLDRTNAGAWYNMGFLEAARKATHKAIQNFNEAIRLDSGYVDARINRGILQMQSDRADSALLDFEWVVVRRPNDARAWQLRGWAHCELGKRAQGCIDLSEASRLGLGQQPDHLKLITRYCK
jgi:tetratricopeptide (TPR) repeat protein